MLYIYIYIYIICTYVRTYVCMCVYVRMYVCVCAYVYACVRMCVSVSGGGAVASLLAALRSSVFIQLGFWVTEGAFGQMFFIDYGSACAEIE